MPALAEEHMAVHIIANSKGRYVLCLDQTKPGTLYRVCHIQGQAPASVERVEMLGYAEN